MDVRYDYYLYCMSANTYNDGKRNIQTDNDRTVSEARTLRGAWRAQPVEPGTLGRRWVAGSSPTWGVEITKKINKNFKDACDLSPRGRERENGTEEMLGERMTGDRYRGRWRM